ncbi:MAG: formyl transferase domain protein [Gemmatimonadetes bacterium]|nr:formyl transferase domain protein [Gemmatimonadota bacterium]
MHPAPDTLRPVVFAYDFPHKKTQDVILRLVASGVTPAAVIAAPPVDLHLPPSALRVKARHVGLVDPSALCAALHIEYHVVDHRSSECLMELDLLDTTLGIIAGARILPRSVIERFSRGIINLHPGLLPATRGLDAMQWTIYRDLPLGVSAHLIDHRVDAGALLLTQQIDEYPDDTLVDVSLRLYETQLDVLPEAIRIAMEHPAHELPQVEGGSHNRGFPAELVPLLRERFRERRRRMRRGRSMVRASA